MVKNSHALQETRVRSLCLEGSLEKGMATHSSILGLEKSHGQRSLVGHSSWCHIESDMAERLTLSYIN